MKIGTTKVNKKVIVAESAWDQLRFHAQVYDDAIKLQTATGNRVGRAEFGGTQSVGLVVDSVEAMVKVAKAELLSVYRTHMPSEIRAWQEDTPWIGEHTLARLLGTIGDPCIAVPMWWEGTGPKRVLMEGDPYIRTVAQLWQYAGVGDPHRKRTKGMTADDAMGMGNPTSKMLVYLMAEASMKGRKRKPSVYGDLYDKLREQVEDKVHTVECRRCGPSGKPKQPGTPWNKGHQMGHALRLVSKQILADIYEIRLVALTS